MLYGTYLLEDSKNDGVIIKTSRTIIEHMIKYKYIQHKQSGSWLITIRDSHITIVNKYKTSKTTEMRRVMNSWDEIYENGINRVINKNKEELPKSELRKLESIIRSAGIEITFDDVINPDFINNWVKEYMHTYQAEKWFNNNSIDYGRIV